MAESLRIVHYLNQYFGGIGGEEHANAPFQVEDGAVGPGRAVQQLLKERGAVVATFVCGDNYFVEEEESTLAAIKEAIRHFRPHLVLAGPAFDAGRYGVACAQMCAVAREEGIPAVTAMHHENPGYTTFRRHLLCLPTGTHAADMQSALASMVELGLKLARGEKLGPAAEEGYLPTGVRRPVVRDRPAWERAIDMLEARVSGEPFQSEVLLQQYETVPIPAAIADLGQVKLGLVTSGGLVPRGNPDGLTSGFAQEGFRYSVEGLNQLAVSEWESVHGGFNTQVLNTKSPNYVLPLPALRELEEEGKIGSIYPFFHSTVGNGTAVTCAKQIGEQIAQEFREAQIGAALLVAT
jgi:glycine reductase